LLEILYIAPILGIIAGFLSGLLGIGGGIVLVPALLYLLPLLPQVNSDNVAIIAVATSLMTIVITAFSSARSHYKRGNLHKEITLPIAVAVAISSVVAPYVAIWMGSSLLTSVFAILLFVLALQIVTGRKTNPDVDKLPSNKVLAFGGLFTGFLAAIAGLGGGAILVPYLTVVGVNIRKSIGAAAACGMIVAIFGSVSYFISGHGWTDSNQFAGYVHWPTALVIMLFSYFTAPLGVKVGHKLNQVQLKRVFAIFMMVVATKLLFDQLA
jgi:uncharacterized membrane protein YfcA